MSSINSICFCYTFTCFYFTNDTQLFKLHSIRTLFLYQFI